MNKTSKVLHNIIALLIFQLVTILAGFILPQYTVLYFGSEVNGLVTSITQIISTFLLVEAGLSSAAMFSLYKTLGDNNHHETNRILVAARNFYYKAGIFFTTLVIILSLIYPLFINNDTLDFFEIVILIFILGINGVLEMFTLAKYRTLLTADQKNYVISYASSIQVILSVVVMIAGVHYSWSIVIIKFVTITGIFIRTIILIIYSKANYKYIDFSVSPNNKALDQRWDAFYLQVLGTVVTVTPIFILTIFSNLEQVSVYSVYNIVMTGLLAIISIFNNNGIAASFGHLIKEENEVKTEKTFNEFNLVYLVIITFLFGCALVSINSFIKIYTSNFIDQEIYIIESLGLIMIINGFIYSIKLPMGMMIVAGGHYRNTRMQTTIQGLLAILGGITGFFIYGLIGLVIGIMISNIYRSLDQLFFIKKYYSVRKSQILKNWIVAALILFTTWYVAKFININDTNYFLWAFDTGIFALVLISIEVIVFSLLNLETVKRLLERIRFILNSRKKVK